MYYGIYQVGHDATKEIPSTFWKMYSYRTFRINVCVVITREIVRFKLIVLHRWKGPSKKKSIYSLLLIASVCADKEKVLKNLHMEGGAA